MRWYVLNGDYVTSEFGTKHSPQRVNIRVGVDHEIEFLYSIKKEGTPASFRLKTARSTISR